MAEDSFGESEQSVWNFDGAELYLLFQIKAKIVFALEEWDLENAYRKLRLLRMEIDAKLKRGDKKQDKFIQQFQEEGITDDKLSEKSKETKKKTEKQEVDERMKKLDELFSKHSSEGLEFLNNENKSELYSELESFYMFLCYLMKKHGLYYREGEDMRLAVLRR